MPASRVAQTSFKFGGVKMNITDTLASGHKGMISVEGGMQPLFLGRPYFKKRAIPAAANQRMKKTKHE